MTELTIDEITEAVSSLNTNYGRGYVDSVRPRGEGRYTVFIQLQYGTKTCRARVVGRTVHFMEHQRTVKEVKTGGVDLPNTTTTV